MRLLADGSVRNLIMHWPKRYILTAQRINNTINTKMALNERHF